MYTCLRMYDYIVTATFRWLCQVVLCLSPYPIHDGVLNACTLHRFLCFFCFFLSFSLSIFLTIKECKYSKKGARCVCVCVGGGALGLPHYKQNIWKQKEFGLSLNKSSMNSTEVLLDDGTIPMFFFLNAQSPQSARPKRRYSVGCLTAPLPQSWHDAAYSKERKIWNTCTSLTVQYTNRLYSFFYALLLPHQFGSASLWSN